MPEPNATPGRAKMGGMDRDDRLQARFRVCKQMNAFMVVEEEGE